MTATAQRFDATERRSYLGASEFAAVMGVDRYRTPLDVYNSKLGLVPDFEGNNHTERGNRLEAIAANLFTELTGEKLQRRNKAYAHPLHAFIVGHVDRIFVGQQRIAEIKCPSVAAFRRLQREGLPESYIVQAQGYMGLSGYPALTWIIFCADVWDSITFTIEFDRAIYDASVAACVDLWNNHILLTIPPEPEAADKSALESERIGGDITRRDDEVFTEAAQLLREAAQIKADGEELYELAKTKIKDAIEGEYGRYEGGGLRLYFTQQAGRKSFDKKALAAAFPQIDLSAFEKQGAPFETLRAFFTNE